MSWLCRLLSSTTFQTIVSGILIFIFGQLFIEYVLKPLQRYTQLRAKAAFCLTYYANRYDSTTEISDDTSVELRKMAAELASFATEKPFVIFSIKRKRLRDASSNFIGLSNSVSDRPDYEMINESTNNIKRILSLN